MILLFRLLFAHEFRLRFNSIMSIAVFIFGIAGSLLTYYWTSRALGPQIEASPLWNKMSYFEYLLWGDFLILIPLALLEAPMRFCFTGIQTHFIDEIFLNSPNPFRSMIFGSLGFLLKDILALFIYLLVICYFLFDHINATMLLRYFFTLVFSIPCFLFLGLLVSQIYFVLKRGAGLVSQLGFLISLISGVYFPVQIFTVDTQKIFQIISPYNIFMSFNRNSLLDQTGYDYLSYVIAISIWGFVLFFLSTKLFPTARSKYLTAPPADHVRIF